MAAMPTEYSNEAAVALRLLVRADFFFWLSSLTWTQQGICFQAVRVWIWRAVDEAEYCMYDGAAAPQHELLPRMLYLCR